MTILGDDVKSRIEPDATENSVVLPHSDAGFTADGVLYGWKAFLQEPMQQVSHETRGIYTAMRPFLKFDTATWALVTCEIGLKR